MRAVRSKNTRPEMLVRSLVHKSGYRYRLHRGDLPGRPDLVFLSTKKVIFVHGCFWHGHGCSERRNPKSRLSFWHSKIAQNKKRDEHNIKQLTELGWECLVLWECALRDKEALAHLLSNFLGPNQSTKLYKTARHS